MPDYVADDYADIARRMREIGGVSGAIATAGRYGIWFEPSDRDPGWCKVNAVTGKWSVWRDGDDGMPDLFDSASDARRVIDSKVGGAWDTSDMVPKRFEG